MTLADGPSESPEQNDTILSMRWNLFLTTQMGQTCGTMVYPDPNFRDTHLLPCAMTILLTLPVMPSRVNLAHPKFSCIPSKKKYIQTTQDAVAHQFKVTRQVLCLRTETYPCDGRKHCMISIQSVKHGGLVYLNKQARPRCHIQQSSTEHPGPLKERMYSVPYIINRIAYCMKSWSI